MHYISNYERQLIRNEVRHQLLNEGLFDAIKGLAGDNLTVDKILPDTVATSIKKMMIKSFMKKMGITSTHPMSEFLQNLIANISISDIANIYMQKITCEEVGEIILKAATQTLTTLGLKKIAVPIVHYFSEHSFDSGAPNFVKKEDKFKSISASDVNKMIDSMLGVLGETLISKIVYAFVKDNMVPIIRDQVCKELLGKSVSTDKKSVATGVEVLDAPKKQSSNPEPLTIDVTPGTAALSGPTPPSLTGPVTENLTNKYNRNMIKNFSRNELYLIREYCELTKEEYRRCF